MNNNLEFENEDPCPDSIENNHPRTNYGEGYGGKETLEEAAERYSREVWGVYYDDTHPHIAIHSTQGEITAKDFIAGHESALADIRNKLTPFQNLLTMLDNGLMHGTIQFHQLLAKEIEECKRSITYLTKAKIK